MASLAQVKSDREKDNIEKHEIYSEEHSPEIALDSADAESIPEQGTEERILAEGKLVRKLDTRVLPIIVLIFIMNYIDVCDCICLAPTALILVSG